MMTYEETPRATVKVGEEDLAGRRVAVQAVPYSGAARVRFDPVERVFVPREESGTIAAGPSEPEIWSAAVAGGPLGAVLIGPCAAAQAERIRGAYKAAAEGAIRSGRGVYLLDPAADGLPAAASNAAVAVFGLLPDVSAALRRLSAAVGRGFASGVLLPLVPGWTDSETVIERTVADAATAGALFVAPVVPSLDGAARRRIVEARAEIEPDVADAFFERVHHEDPGRSIDAARLALLAACRRCGLAVLPKRPRGTRERASNAAVAARLEENAEIEASNEHTVALRHGAARWIDELGRDVEVIFREGNFRKIFPFGVELAREAEAAIEESVCRAEGVRAR